MRTWPVLASWTMPAMRPPALVKSSVGWGAAVVIKSLSDCEGVGARAAKSPLARRGGGLGSESCCGFRSPYRQPPSRDAHDGGVRDGAGEGSLSLRLRAKAFGCQFPGTPPPVFLRKVFKILGLGPDPLWQSIDRRGLVRKVSGIRQHGSDASMKGLR